MPEFDWPFTLALLANGVMIGLMYTLIALGFSSSTRRLTLSTSPKANS